VNDRVQSSTVHTYIVVSVYWCIESDNMIYHPIAICPQVANNISFLRRLVQSEATVEGNDLSTPEKCDSTFTLVKRFSKKGHDVGAHKMNFVYEDSQSIQYLIK
jgi:hypothetical protein